MMSDLPMFTLRPGCRLHSVALVFLIALYLFFLRNPALFFSHHYQYRNLSVHSDRPIPAEMSRVAADVLSRLRKSELFDDTQEMNIFICNDGWRYWFFTRSGRSGGQVNFLWSANAFIRACDVRKNRIIPPKVWSFSLSDRPLSYFMAHELTHSMQRGISPLLSIRCPKYILEGYADYIAKGSDFSVSAYQADLRADDPRMNPENGVYNLYCLEVGYLMERRQYSFTDLIGQNPPFDVVLEDLKGSGH